MSGPPNPTRGPRPPVPDALARALRGDDAGALLDCLEGPAGLAAFDADGTLWDGDIGEAVLQVLIAERRLIDPPPDPWEEYVRRVRRDPADGFAFAGALMAGLSEAEVLEVSERVFAEQFAGAIFPELRWIVSFLFERSWDIYIVSASNRWSVAVGARAFGVGADRVVALDVACPGGILAEVRTPIPTLEGKPTLLRLRAGRDPDLAFGNSVLDLPLLLAAARPVAVGLLRSVGRPRNQFLSQAERRGWARLEIPPA